LIGEGCFLLVTFLCSLSKKSNSPKAKAVEAKATQLNGPARGGAPGGNETGSFRGAVTFLCSLSKKSNSPKAKAFDPKAKQGRSIQLSTGGRSQATATPWIYLVETTAASRNKLVR